MKLTSSLSIKPDEIVLPARLPLSVSTSLGVSPSFQRLHWHRALEINWITKGSGIYVINGQDYPFVEGDLFLIDSHDLHRAYEGTDLEMVIIMFEPVFLGSEYKYDHDILLPFRQMGNPLSNHISQEHPAAQQLGQYVMRMYQEYQGKGRSYASAIRGWLLLFLTEMNRSIHTGQGEQSRAVVKHLEQIRHVVQVMEAKLAYPWTLKELADEAHLSPSRFSALFCQIVGTSPMKYLVQLRIDHAVGLLEQDDISILEIAEASGFRNLSNFNRLFLGQTGTTPSVLKRRLHGEEVE
ncbi:AraC family transcriptional regulator [Paenibacillus motobuensis]|uniref:AraC family transcriptional regulator n=1 Tax=Paenibacillus TaxID=44249 RepID=UPI00203B662B|nr:MULTISPECIES: AraC family transcriptional regulator [Paenibacillus]MCM3038583.1 AraC family transcriptional regulator [Paenibacillus lutimineralis]MCM3645687.1 AraC family transcriptional regulator [Paenibacillus motobuensis]